MMTFYSAALALGLTLSAPWWLLRMLTTERYREGLGERLGRVPARLREAVVGRRVVWLHAVSVGEVLAASRLVVELEAALNARNHKAEDRSWIVAISTTTRTGQALARERFGAERVFYFPLDFAWAVRAYVRVLRPAALLLMESELWPRVLHECRRSGVPVAVVNARVSDRSFSRAMRVRGVWGRVLRNVSLWLMQSEEDARRIVALSAREEAVQVYGNLKYDVRATTENVMARRIASLLWKSRLVVAGSTLPEEEKTILSVWPAILKRVPDAVLLLAPRHRERFSEVYRLMKESGFPHFRCEDLLQATEPVFGGTLLLLNTIGDLAAVYQPATLAFVGGSLVPKGGHNPLEGAQFGVPVVMGPSFENFRDVVAKMQAMDGIRIVADADELQSTMIDLLRRPETARAIGERGRTVFEDQGGATARAVQAIIEMVETRETLQGASQ